MRGSAVILLLIGGLLLGLGLGGLVHDAVTRLAPPHQIAKGEALYGAVAGFGLAVMILASWVNNKPRS